MANDIVRVAVVMQWPDWDGWQKAMRVIKQHANGILFDRELLRELRKAWPRLGSEPRLMQDMLYWHAYWNREFHSGHGPRKQCMGNECTNPQHKEGYCRSHLAQFECRNWGASN